MKKRLISILILLIISLISSPLFAYIESLPLLLEHIVKSNGNWNAVELEGTETKAASKDSKSELRLALARPGKICFDRKSTKAVKNGGRINDAFKGLDSYEKKLLKLMAYSSDKAELFSFFKSWGIDYNEVALGLLNGKPCFIIGAKEGEEAKPQIWFDKKNYHPVRLILNETTDGKISKIDIRLSGWEKPVGADLMPSRIEFYIDNMFVKHWEFSKLNPKLRDMSRFSL